MPQYLAPGVYVEEVPSAVRPIAGVGTSTAGFVGVVPDTVPVPNPAFKATQAEDATNNPKLIQFTSPAAGEARLCTNFGEFVRQFGDFSSVPDNSLLAHAVYGFFNNGGTRCYVARVAAAGNIGAALTSFAAIDEIALVAAPGLTTKTAETAVINHCEGLEDRFAILDTMQVIEANNVFSPDLIDPSKDTGQKNLPGDSDYAAVYAPWLQVFDPALSLQEQWRAAGDPDNPIADPAAALRYVPPSGHVAGIYARVDSERGVHKAPANEVVRGALDLAYRISRDQQTSLNQNGVNCIRSLNGNIRVWGARTLGGDANAEWKYVNVRRLFLFLRESIDQGTQWVVFEPNDASLWAKIRRNVEAFLTNVWRDGALFGDTAAQAFYVKCDEETNPPEVRDLGQVITEIGVAVVKPAEFVVFRISQWAGPPGN
jgi:hypothetical protein